ncbi:hypothetical protein ISS30_08780 [bacterium]|nr:hypothetical protein [bacterium]
MTQNSIRYLIVDMTLDCFAGSGTTLIAAQKLNRHWIGIDNSEIAIQTILKRLIRQNDLLDLNSIIFEGSHELLDR